MFQIGVDGNRIFVFPIIYRITPLALLALVLSACNGATTNTTTPSNPTPNGQARLRIVDGSPDAGTLTVSVDGSALATTSFGSISGYQTLNAGSHTLTVAQGGNTVITQTINLSSAGKFSAVVAGELHPSYTPGMGISSTPTLGTLNVQLYGDPLFGTQGNAATVVFHHASTWATTSTQPVPVGFVTPATSTFGTNFTTLSYGQVTTALSLPQTAVGQSVAFYVLNPGNGVLMPSQVDASDSANVMPFNTDLNLTMYVVDGGGATTQPAAGVPGANAVVVGIFDQNG